jgi:hypothetical protein
MGILDFFSKNRGSGPHAKHIARVANKRAQANDRWDSIVHLSNVGTDEAVEALLVRFTYRTDPSITDQEEKDAALQGVVSAGEVAIAPCRRALKQQNSIAWPLKCLGRVAGVEVVADALLELLDGMDADYERDPEKKVQTLLQLEEMSDRRIIAAVTRFLDDVSEPARFHAMITLLVQDAGSEAPSGEVKEVVMQRLATEESGRIRAKILDACIERDWSIGTELLSAVRASLPTGYSVNSVGKVTR